MLRRANLLKPIGADICVFVSPLCARISVTQIIRRGSRKLSSAMPNELHFFTIHTSQTRKDVIISSFENAWHSDRRYVIIGVVDDALPRCDS